METVRVGISIRKPELHIRLRGNTAITMPDRAEPYILPAGTYTARLAQRSDAPLWGAKVCSFIDRSLAEEAAELLSDFDLACELLTMGGSATWGEENTLDTTVTSLVIGRGEDLEQVLTKAREQLSTIPAEVTVNIPGLRRYEDELPRVEAVRLNPPSGGRIQIQREGGTISNTVPSPVTITPQDPDDLFELGDVTIGIQFHWQHNEALSFRGSLQIVADGKGLTAVNEVELDEYLTSLLGSEMRSDWPDEALAAQAIAARSTVLATRNRHHFGEAFQLCHDDHCQCYQGVSRESEDARRVLQRVKGMLLMHEGRVADARYAKISGVLTDGHEVAWDDEVVPYLIPVPCGPTEDARMGEVETAFGRSGGENLREWFRNMPDWTACNPVAHPYPPSAKEMEELYLWHRSLSWEQVTELVKERTGADIGRIHQLEPLERGISGRIVYLRVHGSAGTITVGKELAIRRLLSDSHLPSSAFLIRETSKGVDLEGLGWGHGVGLCQLGSCGLAATGWDFRRILNLYYPGCHLLTV